MPTLWASDPLRWGDDVLQHMVTTGHRQLAPADDPERRTFGIACVHPGCTNVFRIAWTHCHADTSPAGRLIADYMRTSMGKQLVINQLIKSAEAAVTPRPAAPPNGMATDP